MTIVQAKGRLAIMHGLLIALVLSALNGAAHAGSSKVIKSCSAYGNGCIIAPVRQGRWGLETRLPSGTWIDCRGDCREAIRQDILDFWETQSEKALIVTP